MKHEQQEQLSQIFAALGSHHRRSMVDLLSLRPASILQLAEELGLSLPAIHRHVKSLEVAGLVVRKKSGRVNFLAINRNALRLLHSWLDQYQAHWGTNGETLENYVAAIARHELTNKRGKK